MSRKQKFGKWLLKRMGWSAVGEIAPEPKCVLLGVPHTSVVDFVVAWAFYTSIGGTPNIMIKKEFFFWPMGILLRKMGAVPVDRSKGASVAMHSIQTMQKAERMHLAIAPEGTRKKTERWKMGFLTIARLCNVPIYLGYFDYGTKRVGKGVRFMPTDNPKEDLKKIQAHYAALNLKGRKPNSYSCGNVEPKLIEEDIDTEP